MCQEPQQRVTKGSEDYDRKIANMDVNNAGCNLLKTKSEMFYEEGYALNMFVRHHTHSS